MPLLRGLRVVLCAVGILGGATGADSTFAEAISEPGIRLRVVWGGGEPRRWSGSLRVPDARLGEPTPLGLEADSPGSMWLRADGQDEAIEFLEPSVRVYDGVDFLVRGRLEGVLQVEFRRADKAEATARIDVPLSELVGETYQSALDETGNRLVISRAPGDRLQLLSRRDSLVFRPAESWPVAVMPHLPEIDGGSQVQIKLSLARVREGRVIWSDNADWTAGSGEVQEKRNLDRPDAEPGDGANAAEQEVQAGAVRVDVPIPQEEGAYELTIVASRLRLGRLVPAKPIAERRVQFVVVAEAPPEPAETTGGWSQEIEIDPANPGWLDRLRRWPVRPRIPWLMTTGPLGSGDAKSFVGPFGSAVRLAARPELGAVSWQAYPLPLRLVGTPHLLEVEVSADRVLELGITIVEPNAAGQVVPASFDSGVLVQRPLEPDAPAGMILHRLIFWPRTRTPILLLSNRGAVGDAVFGKIRVLAADQEHLPTAWQRPSSTERLAAAYLERPQIPENFLASDLLDASLGQGLDDWQTFFEGSTRLVEYLRYAGCNGLFLGVLADGSTIYPSRLLQPTPKYDTGILATTGMDPVRKDVLELAMRLFDRQGLRLVPALQFSSPLPALESLRRQSPAQESGLEWIDGDGAAWSELRPSSGGLSAYYNPLHPQVQQSMVDVVRELVERYGHHESFHGLALQLAAPGYGHLLGPEWGMDDATIARFQSDTGTDVPGEGPERFRQRAAFLLEDEKNRQVWLAWRAGRLRDLHSRMAEALDAARPGLKLHIIASALFEDPDIRRRLKPVLPKRDRIVQTLYEMGIDLKSYNNDERMVFLRPEWISAPQPLARRAVDMELNTAAQLDRELSAASFTGSVFVHRSEPRPLPSFDQQSPFGKDKTYTVLSPCYSPAGDENRRRFAHSIAVLDARVMVDGGSLLAMGQEDPLRPLLEVFRRLPLTCDETTTLEQQPITVRVMQSADETWVYVVNDSPWDVTAVVPVVCRPTCRREPLDPQREETWTVEGTGGVWTVPLRPYDLAASRFSEKGVTIEQPSVEPLDQVQEALEQQVQQLNARMASLQEQSALRVLSNPGFETGSGPDDIPGWEIGSGGPLSAVQRAQQVRHDGLHSLRLSSEGPPATVRSLPFDTPRTGRLALYAWVRSANNRHSPAVRLGLEGLDGGKAYYRFASIGGPASADTAVSDHWKLFAVAFNELPVDQLQRVRLRIDLMDPGTVWIDDVRLDRLYFDDAERRGLYKIVVSAGYQLKNGQVGDCQRLLEGYWPSFLAENVAVTRPALADNTPPAGTKSPRGPTPNQPEKQPSLADRLKGLMPGFLRY